MKTFKIFIASILCVIFICTGAFANEYGLININQILQMGDPTQKGIGGGASDASGEALDNAKTIYFGKYWQDKLKSGETDETKQENYEKTAIKWRVLDTKAPLDVIPRIPSPKKTGVFLFADKALYADQYNEYDEDTQMSGHNKNIEGEDANKWRIDDQSTGSRAKESDIRETLNNTIARAGFAGDAFAPSEYRAIAITSHTADGEEWYDGYNILSSDKLFLLSYYEVQNPAYGFADSTYPYKSLVVKATLFAQKVPVYLNESGAEITEDGYASYWLRSPSEYSYADVTYDGWMAAGDVAYGDNAVRPALNLDPDKILFLTAATGGKSDVKVGEGFTLKGYDGSNGWKLTLIDDTLPTPTDIKVTQSYTGYKTPDDLVPKLGKAPTIDLTHGLTATYTGDPKITYRNAPMDGRANYVSAILKDMDGNLLNYAKISDQVSATDVPIVISNLANGAYKISVFAEQANGDYETDYASALSEFIIGKGENTVYEGKLSAAYCKRQVTAKLGGNFNLSFDNAAYGMDIIVPQNQTATITAEATNGTSLYHLSATAGETRVAGNMPSITVSSGAELTVANAFRLDNVRNDGVITVKDNGILFTRTDLKNAALYFSGLGKLVNNGIINANLKFLAQDAKLENNGTWYPAVVPNPNDVPFVNETNVIFNETGIINLNDVYWDGHTERNFKTLALVGALEANGGTFVLNTNLAAEDGDKVNLSSASGYANVKIAYDPFFNTAKVGSKLYSGYQFLTVGSGSISLTPVETRWNKGGYTYSFKPTIASENGGSGSVGREWCFTGFDKVIPVEGPDPTPDPKLIPNPPVIPGFVGVVISETTKAVSDTARAIGTALVATTSNLQKRLGDLRGGEASNTGWVRFERNLDDLNSGRQLNVSGNMYQIGYDFALKNDAASRGYFGLSLERFDGNQSFKIGGGDLKSTSLGVYYTKIYNSGHYFDLTFHYGRYESDTASYDFTVDNPELTKLDYALNGVTFSGEYGYRWNLGKSGLYLEPQAEFIYGYLGSARKTTSTGYLAEIDSSSHFITRCGVALGQHVKNFNYYLKASYYHDFDGTSHITYNNTPYKQDGAKNWWEVSLGGGWNIDNASYFYAELTKHFKDISNSLNFNLGFRFTL